MFYSFYQHLQPLYDVMQKQIDNLEFVQGVNLGVKDSSKISGTQYLLIFENSCEEICISKAFVDVAFAWRHHGLSTIYIEHNLFHHSKHGRDVELQNTNIVLFKSPRDVIQVSTLSAQTTLWSERACWCRNTTFVPYGHLLIDFSPRTDDRLRYCTDTGSILSKLYVPERLKHFKFLDGEHTKPLYSPSLPIIFPLVQKAIFSVLSKKFHPVSLWNHNKSA